MGHVDLTGTTGAGASAATQALLVEADRLLGSGEPTAAIASLAAANRAHPDTDLERALVRLRAEGFAAAHRSDPGGPASPFAGPDPFAGSDGIPEIDAADLDVEAVRAGVLGHGSLLVRGLVPPAAAERCARDIDHVFAAYDDAAAAGGDDALPWYEPFPATGPVTWTVAERLWAHQLGGIMAADSPRALARVVDLFHDVGLDGLLTDYLGERPALSVKKFTLRRTAPDAPTEWHQDGSFLGADIRTLNVWLALSPCGVDAPSLDVVARRFDSIVDTGTDDSLFDWSVSRAMADRVSGGAIHRPTFAPGDAILFDQMTLHRTGIDPAMTRPRYAIESWFFAPSTYPSDQIPLVF